MRFQTFKCHMLGVIAALIITGCTGTNAPSIPPQSIHLTSGIPGMVELNDSENAVSNRLKDYKIDITANPDCGDVQPTCFSYLWHLKQLGLRIYFRKGMVVLIEIQEPFNGVIAGKDVRIFPFSAPHGEDWKETLVRLFGTPSQQAAGGRLKSSSLFFSWGDVAYNHMGLNEIAIYRDSSVKSFRETSFGRRIELFKN